MTLMVIAYSGLLIGGIVLLAVWVWTKLDEARMWMKITEQERK